MAIAFGTTGGTQFTSNAASATVDITTASVGDWVYALLTLGASETSVTATGWTILGQGLGGGSTPANYYAFARRQKQVGDTTFSWSWTATNTKGEVEWLSYSGLDGTTPDEGFAFLAHGTTNSTSFATPSATPTAANRWVLAGFYTRSTTAGAFTWSPPTSPITLTERLDAATSGGTNPWTGCEFADSNGAVTQTAQSYTATCSQSEAQGGAFILFLIPASGSNVNVADTAQASLAGTRADATTIAVQVADKAQASEAGTRADATTIAVRVADVVQASEAGTLSNATTIGVAIADTASAALANTRADNVTIIGNVSQIDTTRAGVLAARQPQESVTINSITPVTVADTSRSGVLAARQPQETVTITTSVPTPDVISVLTTQRPTSRLATVVKTFTCDQPRLTSRLVQVHVISTLSQVRSTSDLPG